MSDEEEAFAEMADWCAKVYREVGVTPELRKALDFYRKHYPDDCTYPHSSR